MTELDTHFTVCTHCDESKNITKGLIALEDVREFQAKRQGIHDYVRKWVTKTPCLSHQAEIAEAIYDYAPKK